MMKQAIKTLLTGFIMIGIMLLLTACIFFSGYFAAMAGLSFIALVPVFFAVTFTRLLVDYAYMTKDLYFDLDL